MSAGVVYPSEQNQNVINGIENDIDELQEQNNDNRNDIDVLQKKAKQPDYYFKYKADT